MYFMVVPSSGALAGRWPPVGAGTPILDILHQDSFLHTGVRRRHLGAGEDVAVDLNVDTKPARVEPADSEPPATAASGRRSALSRFVRRPGFVFDIMQVITCIMRRE